jgi:hypothetical protein
MPCGESSASTRKPWSFSGTPAIPKLYGFLRLILAGFAAIEAVVVSIDTKADIKIVLADGTVTLATANLFLRTALQTSEIIGHGQECIAFLARLK